MRGEGEEERRGRRRLFIQNSQLKRRKWDQLRYKPSNEYTYQRRIFCAGSDATDADGNSLLLKLNATSISTSIDLITSSYHLIWNYHNKLFSNNHPHSSKVNSVETSIHLLISNVKLINQFSLNQQWCANVQAMIQFVVNLDILCSSNQRKILSNGKRVENQWNQYKY